MSGKNKTEVRAKLAELHDELNDGVVTNASYTAAHAIEDGLAAEQLLADRGVLDDVLVGAV